ncbi:competence type IV pilus minor pilin ComGG [Halalkalibacter oceani]|uniref:competence type IV pilus minor pilin ComGG n=1 Tax=Halalkalibacter oceani TaxID=1653776 RepID=UPI0033972F11
MNAKGFIYPLTILLSLLLCAVLFQQIAAYATAKQFVEQQEKHLELQSLLQIGIAEFQKERSEPVEGEIYTFSYPSGTVTLEVREKAEDFSAISVLARLKSGEQRQASFQYRWPDAVVEGYQEV